MVLPPIALALLVLAGEPDEAAAKLGEVVVRGDLVLDTLPVGPLPSELEGVKELQGREVRVIVNPQKVDDEQAREISKALRQKIEEELQYPSTIKVTVIRETRYTETAV